MSEAAASWWEKWGKQFKKKGTTQPMAPADATTAGA